MATTPLELQAAQKQLKHLYHALTRELGKPPDFERFYPVDVERLISDSGWRLKVVAGEPAFVNPLRKVHALSDSASNTVFISSNESGERRRFTLAHELGHILLHPTRSLARSSAPRSVRNRVKPAHDLEFERLETAADRFAAELLMPAKAVRRAFAELFGKAPLIPEEAESFSVSAPQRDRFAISRGLSRYAPEGTGRSICSIFGVSEAAAGRRILELDLLA